MIYRLIKRLIELGQTDGLAHKVDVFFAVGRLTDEEYAELVSLLPAPPEA